MNIVRVNKKFYKYESFWRSSKYSKERDYNGNLFPWPKESKEWQNRKLFLMKLKETEDYLKKKKKIKWYKKEDYKDCIIDGEENITKGFYQLNSIRWETGLYHYIDKHKIKPSNEFIDHIFRFIIGTRIIEKKRSSKIKGVTIIKQNKTYMRIDRNQILILDALMKYGSYKIYVDKKNKKIFRYSEHAGLLDFNENKLERIIVSGKTTRIDENDDDIFLPKNMLDAFDYEYIFHTHPPTPKPGGRVHIGILYEFPSISDIFHFIDHYNKGVTQGSLVITPEGLYNIRKNNLDNKKIKIDENKFYHDMMKIYNIVQSDAIKKYGTNFTMNQFFSKIAQDVTFINQINKIANKYDIQIDYYPRIKDIKNHWIIDTIYVPVYSIEPKYSK